jgi:signal recognition particle GTPase
MEELTKEIKRLKKDNDRFKLNEKLKECQKANKQLEKLFESFERELLKEDISKEREEEIIDILDSQVYMIGR